MEGFHSLARIAYTKSSITLKMYISIIRNTKGFEQIKSLLDVLNIKYMKQG